jgi:hypothetical protein
MSTLPVSLRRVAIGLLLVDVIAVALIAGTLLSARKRADQSEEMFVALARDVTRASQMQATAERMVAIGRGYLLTVEPELLARSQAAEAKLGRALQAIAMGRDGSDDLSLEPVLLSAKRYRDVFSALLSGEVVPREPREVANALRKRLIPARDDLLGELDELIGAKLGQLEAVRTSDRDERTRTMNVVAVTGAFGILASVFLLSMLLAGVRAAVAVVPAQSCEAVPSQPEPPRGSRLAAVYQFPRKNRTPRPRS